MLVVIEPQRVKRWFWRAALALDLGVLWWLVWTPSAAHRCDAETSLPGQAFCLEPWLSWTGNVLLLVPTALLVTRIAPRVRLRDIAIAMLLLACTIELVQHWIPGRNPDWRDVTANAAGAWLALVGSAIYRDYVAMSAYQPNI